MPVPWTSPFFRYICGFYNRRKGERFMARSEYPHFLPPKRKLSDAVLAFSFLFGILSGVVLFFAAGVHAFPLMRGSVAGSVSIVSLLLLNYLPFLISAYAVYISKAWLLFPVAFLRGCLFSFVSLGTSVGFGSAGWLVRLFLLFSDALSLPLLYLFWQRHISGDHQLDFWEIFVYLSLISLIGSIDHRLISPFLASIISI